MITYKKNFALALIVLLFTQFSFANGTQNGNSETPDEDNPQKTVNGFSIGFILGMNYPLFGNYQYRFNGGDGFQSYTTTKLVGMQGGISLRTSNSTKAAFQFDLLYSVIRSNVDFEGTIGKINMRTRSIDLIPQIAVNITDNIGVSFGPYVGMSVPFYLLNDSTNAWSAGLVLGARYLFDFGLSVGIRQKFDLNAMSRGGQYFDVFLTDLGNYRKEYRIHTFEFSVGYHLISKKTIYSYDYDDIPLAGNAENPETKAETAAEIAKSEALIAQAEADKATAEAQKAQAEADKAKAEAELAGFDAPEQKTTETDPNQPQYRGGDPLKGLNVSKTTPVLKLGKYYALLIGIDDYSGQWASLNNAVNDAKAIEELLRSKYVFDKFSTLYNEKATRSVIIKQMEWLVENVGENDNVFIYYSGHGEFKQSLNKGYWVPYGAKSKSTSEYISNNDIQTFLGGIKSKHTLLVSDACFSGDIFRGQTVSVPFEDSEKYYKKVHGLMSRNAITSGGIEPVMDGGKDGHSVFAYYILKTLRNNEAKYYDASQLYNDIKIPVVNNSDQTPKFSPIKNTGDEGGQFVFIRK